MEDFMKKISISDITLRKMAENTKTIVSFNEKTLIAKELDRLCVDVIETAPIVNGKKDVLFLHTISSLLKNSVLACPAGLSIESVEETYDAIKSAAKPRIIISVPVSTVQMEYVCKMKPAKLLEHLKALTQKALSLCEDVEIEFLDCTRAEWDFLKSAIKSVISLGANFITVSDNSGDMLPSETGDFVKKLYSEIDALNKVSLSVLLDDKISMAVAGATEAIRSGADGIKTIMAGEGTPMLGAVTKVIRERGETLQFKTEINVTKLENAIDKLKYITESKGASVTPFDSGTGSESADSFEIVSEASMGEIANIISRMGYELSDDDIKNVYDVFVKAASKKTVNKKELDSIIASVAMQVPSTYKLKSYVINSGDIITPTANIELVRGEQVLRGFCVGDGPVEAAFLAIEKITGHHYELDDFQIQSVTRGYESMGSTLVKLRHNGKVFSGVGTSTDIVGASISAYISALNKISYEEGLA
ncbi:MAG: hypothetical protein E7635_06830 [Ruminococcaceae bacterium]|nr:hypothetical protein [Oscillospiraceae bacterium]